MNEPTDNERPTDEDELRQHAEAGAEGAQPDKRDSERKDNLREHSEDPAEG